jgi:hypothetical protein
VDPKRSPWLQRCLLRTASHGVYPRYSRLRWITTTQRSTATVSTTPAHWSDGLLSTAGRWRMPCMRLSPRSGQPASDEATSLCKAIRSRQWYTEHPCCVCYRTSSRYPSPARCGTRHPSTCNWRSHCAGLSNLMVRIPNWAAAVRFASVSSMNTVCAPSSLYVSKRYA